MKKQFLTLFMLVGSLGLSAQDSMNFNCHFTLIKTEAPKKNKESHVFDKNRKQVKGFPEQTIIRKFNIPKGYNNGVISIDMRRVNKYPDGRVLIDYDILGFGEYLTEYNPGQTRFLNQKFDFKFLYSGNGEYTVEFDRANFESPIFVNKGGQAFNMYLDFKDAVRVSSKSGSKHVYNHYRLKMSCGLAELAGQVVQSDRVNGKAQQQDTTEEEQAYRQASQQ